jgi:hypothetical protein
MCYLHQNSQYLHLMHDSIGYPCEVHVIFFKFQNISLKHD